MKLIMTTGKLKWTLLKHQSLKRKMLYLMSKFYHAVRIHKLKTAVSWRLVTQQMDMKM